MGEARAADDGNGSLNISSVDTEMCMGIWAMADTMRIMMQIQIKHNRCPFFCAAQGTESHVIFNMM